MRRINSLRFKVAFVFATFGALLSIVLAVALFITTQQLGHRLIDETLRAELDDSVVRHARDQEFVPPNTISIRGYVLPNTELGLEIPKEIAALTPGTHNTVIEEVDYRVLVADRNEHRYFMLFNTDSQHERETKFFHFLALFALFMTLSSAAGGFWLALRVVNPLTLLTEQVAHAEPKDTQLSQDKLERADEIGELARAFDLYQQRIHEFIARENYFTADVSHELRTPLAIILGSVEVFVEDATLSLKQQERIERIARAAKDMSEMTSALLLMAREHQDGHEDVICDVGEVTQACIEKHQHLIGDRAIQLAFRQIESTRVSAERPLLEIVIANLLRNALFNTQQGAITLTLYANRFMLTDTGLGMSDEVLQHVFERHFKGATSKGAGVGLSLVKRICERYGWQITLASQEGLGTTVELIFVPLLTNPHRG